MKKLILVLVAAGCSPTLESYVTIRQGIYGSVDVQPSIVSAPGRTTSVEGSMGFYQVAIPEGTATICLERAGMTSVCVNTTIGPGVTRWDFTKDEWSRITVIQ
jgi:hypothetical protein